FSKYSAFMKRLNSSDTSRRCRSAMPSTHGDSLLFKYVRASSSPKPPYLEIPRSIRTGNFCKGTGNLYARQGIRGQFAESGRSISARFPASYFVDQLANA